MAAIATWTCTTAVAAFSPSQRPLRAPPPPHTFTSRRARTFVVIEEEYDDKYDEFDICQYPAREEQFKGYDVGRRFMLEDVCRKNLANMNSKLSTSSTSFVCFSVSFLSF